MLKRFTPLLLLLSVLPLIATAVLVFAVLPDMVPQHVGWEGVDRWGSKYESFVAAGILVVCNLICTACFHWADKLDEFGMLSMPNSLRRTGKAVFYGRIVMAGAVVFCDVLYFALFVPLWLTA